MPEPKSTAVLVCYICQQPFLPTRHHACNAECCIVVGLLPETLLRLHYDFCDSCGGKTLQMHGLDSPK